MTRAERPGLGDERGLVGRSIVILMLLIVVIGVFVIDGASILFTKLSLQNTADQVASDAAADYNRNHSKDGATQVAVQSLDDHDAGAKFAGGTGKAIRFDFPNAGEVTITLKKRATTLVVQRVGFLEDLAIEKATSTSGSNLG